jgi:hypothetical protein
MMMQRVMTILWPGFLAAAMAEGFFFALFDPLESLHWGDWTPSPVAVHTIGFLFFWAVCSLASMLTYYLIKVPADHNSLL